MKIQESSLGTSFLSMQLREAIKGYFQYQRFKTVVVKFKPLFSWPDPVGKFSFPVFVMEIGTADMPLGDR